MTQQDEAEFAQFCFDATDAQLRAIYHKEKLAGRDGYVRIVRDEMFSRRITL